jgi:hypothetical protein
MKVLFLVFLLFISCSSEDVSSNKSISTNKKAVPKINVSNKEPLFEVVKIDKHNDSIQRVFVVIPKEKNAELEYIENVICIIKGDYSLSSKSNVSFFSQKKYADYKDNIFISMNTPKGITPDEKLEYKKWRNSYYLAEYALETGVYQTFPASGDSQKMKKYFLNECK